MIDFMEAWIEAGNPNADQCEELAVVKLMRAKIKEACGREDTEGIRLVRNSKQVRIMFLPPVPTMKDRSWKVTIGNEKSGQRFLRLIPLIVKEYNIREEKMALLKAVGSRFSDPTVPLLVHDEFYEVVELCSNISSRRKEISKLEQEKGEAIRRLQSAIASKLSLPLDLVEANTRNLLLSCCRMYNKNEVILGV